MVTAGVYLLVRMSPVLALSSSGRMTIAVIGGVTAFVAATIATSQKDIKKVLAFSTVSQIGYMVLAVGVGAYGAAIFLMVGTRFYKALLFLVRVRSSTRSTANRTCERWGVGQVPTAHVSDVPRGLARLSGIPPFAGFWAKGDVLTNVFAHNKVLWVLAVVTAILTAYYMSRLFVLTFRGHRALPRGDPRSRAPRISLGHDPPARDLGGALGVWRGPRPAVGAPRFIGELPQLDVRVRGTDREPEARSASGVSPRWTSPRR